MTAEDYKLIAKCISSVFKYLAQVDKFEETKGQINLSNAIVANIAMIEEFSSVLLLDNDKFNKDKFKDYIIKLNKE